MNFNQEETLLRIYKEYCNKNRIIPNRSLLKILQNKENKYSLNDSQQNDLLNETQMFSISLIINQNPDFLIELEISNQQTLCNSISILTSSLKNNTFLKILKLRNDSLNDHAAISLALTLLENKSLLHVDLSENLIKNDGFEGLATALIKNQTLTILILSRNIAHLDFFGSLLKKNGSLIKLDLSYNDYDFDEIQNLLKGLKKNKGLIELNIAGMTIGQINVNKLCKILNHNSVIQVVDMDLDLDEQDFDLIEKLEKGLLNNFSLSAIISEKIPELMENKSTNQLRLKLFEKIRLLLKANLWIKTNLENLKEIENISCENDLLDVLKEKLKVLQNEIPTTVEDIKTEPPEHSNTNIDPVIKQPQPEEKKKSANNKYSYSSFISEEKYENESNQNKPKNNEYDSYEMENNIYQKLQEIFLEKHASLIQRQNDFETVILEKMEEFANAMSQRSKDDQTIQILAKEFQHFKKEFTIFSNSTQIITKTEVFSKEIQALRDKTDKIFNQVNENSKNLDLKKKTERNKFEDFVKLNFNEIFEKINELNKTALHLVKENEKICSFTFDQKLRILQQRETVFEEKLEKRVLFLEKMLNKIMDSQNVSNGSFENQNPANKSSSIILKNTKKNQRNYVLLGTPLIKKRSNSNGAPIPKNR